MEWKQSTVNKVMYPCRWLPEETQDDDDDDDCDIVSESDSETL